MQIEVTQSIIAGSKVAPSLAAGVAIIDGVPQVRQVDARGRIVREGMVILFLKDDRGNEVVVKLDPDETREAAALLPMVAYAAAGVPAPAIQVKSHANEGRLVTV